MAENKTEVVEVEVSDDEKINNENKTSNEKETDTSDAKDTTENGSDKDKDKDTSSSSTKDKNTTESVENAILESNQTTISDSIEEKTTPTNDAALSEMSDNDIEMNFTTISDLCSQWNSKVISLDLTGERVTKGLQVLTSYGIDEQYATALATAVNSLTLTMAEIINTIKSANNAQQSLDERYVPSGNNSYNYVTNTGSNSDTSSNTQINNNNEKDEITIAKIEEKATLNDYIGLSTLLSSIVSTKNSSLDNLFNNFDETQIKKKILLSVNLNDELKQMLYNADSTVLKEALKQFYKNGDLKIIDDFGINLLEKYIEKIALKNDMSITNLLTDNKNNKLLYNEVENYEKALILLGNKEKHNMVKDMYDGNVSEDTDKNLTLSVRDIIDIVASEKKITAEEVFTNSNVMIESSNSKNFISYLKNNTNTQNLLKELYANRG